MHKHPYFTTTIKNSLFLSSEANNLQAQVGMSPINFDPDYLSSRLIRAGEHPCCLILGYSTINNLKHCCYAFS